MYKIEQLPTLLESMEAQKIELPSNLLDFAQFLTNIEKEFQKIDTYYNIDIIPAKNVEDQPVINFKLKYEEKELFEYTTHIPFRKYLELPDYETESYHGSQGSLAFNLQETADFDKNPELYKQVVEDKLIKTFLNNEKEMRSVNELITPIKFKM